jgi:SAM-dependent methyltransferase
MAHESLALTATLKQLAELDRYNSWVYEQIVPGLGERVLEIGAGTGNITQFLCADSRYVVATDIVPSYRKELQQLFGDRPNVEIGKFDLTSKAPQDFVGHPFDTVVCLNVLEHIEDDLFALEQMNNVLKVGGKLALLVPAHRILYGEFDRVLGHYRRYEKQEMIDKLKRVGFSKLKLKYFSLLAALPWFINGRMLKRDYLPVEQANLANRLVPLLKLERLIGPPCGLSLVAIAQKQ